MIKNDKNTQKVIINIITRIIPHPLITKAKTTRHWGSLRGSVPQQ